MSGLYARATANPAGFRDVAPSSVARAPAGTRLVDVREPAELDDALGHVPGIENVPLASLPAASAAWDKEREIVLICRSGGRSARAASYLTSVGFIRVMNMAGGMLAWNAQNLPTAESASPRRARR